MTLRRTRRRAPARTLPAGMTIGSLLPLGLLVGGCALDDEELVASEPGRVAVAA